MTKKYRNKKTGEECFLEQKGNVFIKVYFPDNLGEENGDYDQSRIFPIKRFELEFEEVEDAK